MTAQPTPSKNPPVLGPGDPDYDRWYSEVQYFLSVRQKLWENMDLRGRYIAIQNRHIIDSDPDEFELALRAEREHPGEVVLISQVVLTDPVIDLPPMEIR